MDGACSPGIPGHPTPGLAQPTTHGHILSSTFLWLCLDPHQGGDLSDSVLGLWPWCTKCHRRGRGQELWCEKMWGLRTSWHPTLT